MKKLPANTTADKLATAKARLAEFMQAWTAATEAFKASDVSDTVAKAMAMTAEVPGILGVPVPTR